MKRQEKAQRVTDKLPAKALCFICSQSGDSDEEKPVGAVAYKGKTYYFCNKSEVEKFLKDPEVFIPAPVPRVAPVFNLKTPTGETITLDSFKNKILLIDFWATWCVPCVKAMPEMQKLQEKYSSPSFTVLGISIDEEGAQKVVPFLKKSKVKFTYPIVLDNANSVKTWEQWGIKSVPTVVLVKEGQIMYQWSGKINSREIEETVRKELSVLRIRS